MYINAQTLFDQLNSIGLKGSTGSVIFSLLDVDVKIHEKSAMGDLIQERLGGRMKANDIQYRVPSNSQEFPDFLLDETSDTKGLLEIKTFDYNAGANFDIANFEAYVRSVETHSYRLDADYLIFGYILENGKLTIKDFWLKKIWEISCGSGGFPLKTQNKQGMIYNIRPASRESKKASYKTFGNKLEFLNAIQGTLNLYGKTKDQHTDWLDNVIKDYAKYGGELG